MVRIFLISIFLFSCASKHGSMRGTVALKISDENGVVCNEPDQIKVGDRYSIYNNECTKEKMDDEWARTTKVFCKLKKTGEVEITKLLNDHYAEFKTLSSIKFNEGSIIKL